MRLVRICVVAAVSIAPFALAAFAQVSNATAPSPTEVSEPNVSKYRSWGAVNPTPYRVLPMVAALCRVPLPAERAGMIWRERERNPHADYHIRVYVAPTYAKAAFQKKNASLPVGTVVVKEKLVSATAKTPELLTVMVKRQKGYDPTGGDWQYYVVNGTGTKILADTRLKYCRDCHQDRKAQGFLFRDYLTLSVVPAGH